MPPEPVMTAAEIEAFLDHEFPQMHHGGRTYFIERVEHGIAHVRVDAAEQHLRPGGTISGPTMMTLADYSAYVAILAHIGPVALAVTTSLNINFLRKPSPGPIFGECRILKLGTRLAVVDVAMRSRGSDALVAHATATYSIPKS